MPEMADIAACISALEPRIVGKPLQRVRLASAFLLRTAQPPLATMEGRIVRELRTIGKRILARSEWNRRAHEQSSSQTLPLQKMRCYDAYLPSTKTRGRVGNGPPGAIRLAA